LSDSEIVTPNIFADAPKVLSVTAAVFSLSTDELDQRTLEIENRFQAERMTEHQIPEACRNYRRVIRIILFPENNSRA
jgi:hypothetical protein